MALLPGSNCNPARRCRRPEHGSAGILSALLAAFTSAAAIGLSQENAPNPPLQALLSPKQYQEYSQKPKYKDRIDLYHKAFDGTASELRGHLKKMDMEVVFDNLRKIRALSRYVREDPSRAAASPKDLRSKEVRKLEIRIRQLVFTLNDYRLSVPFDYRAEFETSARDLEELRNELLIQLFGKAAASPRNPA
jgi:hypothetical protein